MFCRRVQHAFQSSITKITFYSTVSKSEFVELPRKMKRSERKPWVTEVNELKRKARLEKQHKRVAKEATLSPPLNGLLVKALVPVAHRILSARAELHACACRVAETIPIHICRICGEVHVGIIPNKIRTCDTNGSKKNKEHTWEIGGIEHVLPVVKSFHLYDRLGRAVSHNERLQVDRIPAIVELCIQAGVDFLEYPTQRRQFPIYRVAGKLLDFEKRFPKDDMSVKHINAFGFWYSSRNSGGGVEKVLDLLPDDLKGIASKGMNAWGKMRSGVKKLIQKYPVQTCGYCSDVQVGPKGHRVRNCQSFKHQMRDGQHGWQEARVDDIVPPVYVWHVRGDDDNNNGLLIDELRGYYGKLPGVVELFAQAGAHVIQDYCGIMREDVSIPEVNEEKLVV